MAGGFQAATEADEKACPDLEVNVPLETEDVAAKVNTGISDRTPNADANRMRKATLARIEKECTTSSGNQYKKYTDVRLVFAPEFAVAQFGGDPDNFMYPRYCLDFSLFRAYENGKPVSSPEYLAWSHTGVKDGELTFVSGNPDRGAAFRRC